MTTVDALLEDVLSSFDEDALNRTREKVSTWDNRENRQDMLNALTLLEIALRKIERLERSSNREDNN